MKLRLISSFLLVIIMLAATTSVAAQEYSFSLDEETVHVYWNGDGTIAVDYVFVFTNDPGAHVIDFVDVGMPNGNYENVSADVDGQPLRISSDYQGSGTGFAVDMGAYAIRPGQTGRLHVYVGRISRMVYPDDDEPEAYASGEFSPTWFGSRYVHGNTNLTVVFHLPPGVMPQEPRYHPARGGWPCSSEPLAAYDDQGRITYTWACPTANGYSQYTFGLSFPRQYVPAEAIVTAPAFSFDWSGLLAGLAGSLQTICCFGFFILIFIGAPIMGVINERRRKLQYLPPKISIEGHGIKRGLTAVEAAILMEQPLDRAMTMVLFGVIKKNAASVLSREPLKLEIASPLPEGLHDYERDFLQAFAGDNQAVRRKELQEMTVKLVKSVSEKMKGFSRKETADYYRNIMERAWQQIEAAGTPEVKSQMYEEALEWTMLDKNYDERTRRVFTGPVYVPMWWGRYDPGYRPAPAKAGASSVSIPGTAGGGRSTVPGASLAASMVNGVQGFSSRVLGDLQSFTSGVTNKTNPPPPPSKSSSGGSRSGGGCACACACAGCACACAGGGR